MPANNNRIAIRLELDTSDVTIKGNQAIKNFVSVSVQDLKRLSAQMEALNKAREQLNSTVGRSHAKLEASELRHAQRLEAIQARSAGQILAIEQRKLASQELMRERAAVKEAQRQARLASQQEQRARSGSGIGFGTLAAGAGALAGGFAAYNFASNAIDKAFELDKQRVQVAAFVGGVENARKKLEEFSKTAQSTAGVTRDKLVEAFIDLKAQAGLADSQATKLSVSIAKLQALYPKAQNTAQNLAQIFNQSFELSDIKQERGQTGDFINSVIKRLGFDGPANSGHREH